MHVETDERSFFRVRRETYTSDSLHERELRSIFDRVWLYLGHDSEIAAPDSFLTREVGGRPLLVTRDGGGRLRAFLNACPHRGAAVCRARTGSARHFTCPYHGWTFDNGGRLTGIPGRDAYGPAAPASRFDLREVALQDYRGFLFVCFSPPEVDLETHLGEARRFIDLICDQSTGRIEVLDGIFEHSMDINWKLLAENGVDAYHLPVAHRRFLDWMNELGTDPSSHRRSGFGRALGNGHGVIESSPPSTGRPIAYWSPLFPETMRETLAARFEALAARVGRERAEEMAHTNRSLFVFPNTVFNDILGLNIRTFFPVSARKVRIRVWGLGFTDETEEDRAMRIANLISFIGPGGFGTPDDVEILESCQRGYARDATGYSDFSRGLEPGTLRHTDEDQNRGFWRRWRELVEGGP